VSESEYIEIAENTFLDLEDKLEILENHVDGFDMTYSDGVMTMDLQEHGIWVMNKQRPNKEIWWSSPLRYGGMVCGLVVVVVGGRRGGAYSGE
jgi:frataxin